MEKVEVFKDDAGEWRWHRKAANGEIIADSGEGYTHKADCMAMAMRVNVGITIVEMEDD